MDEERRNVERELIIPGELLDVQDLKPGMGTFVEDGKIYASQLGVKNVRANYVNIVPLGGKYLPRPGDMVIGKVVDIGPSNWLIDINSPYPATLHVNDVQWRVDFGDTARYLTVGEMVLVEISNVDETKRVQVTMNGQGLKKLLGGQIVEVSHSKVPRVIGKGGSMITMIKSYTKCRLFVGQNGRIWIDGDMENIANAILAIKKIEEEAQVVGLTESIKKLFDEIYKTGGS